MKLNNDPSEIISISISWNSVHLFTTQLIGYLIVLFNKISFLSSTTATQTSASGVIVVLTFRGIFSILMAIKFLLLNNSLFRSISLLSYVNRISVSLFLSLVTVTFQSSLFFPIYFLIYWESPINTTIRQAHTHSLENMEGFHILFQLSFASSMIDN